jgi:hypothetical protein
MQLLKEGHAQLIPVAEYANVESSLSAEEQEKAHKKKMLYVTIDAEGAQRMGLTEKNLHEARDQGKTNWSRPVDLPLSEE